MAIDPVGGLLNFAGDVVGGLFGSSAQDRANEANERIADKQMAFQKEMSNTAYQRSMVDMKAAGLNPMLAYMKGGASTPSGAGATIAPSNPMSGLSSGISNGIHTALDTSNAVQDLKNKAAAQALTEAQTNTEASKALATANSARESDFRARVLQAELPAKAARANVDVKQAGYDDSAIAFDNIVKRAKAATDAGSSALDLVPGLSDLKKFLSPKGGRFIIK